MSSDRVPWSAHREGVSAAEYAEHLALGQRWCSAQRHWALAGEFGRPSWCRPCYNEYRRRRYVARGPRAGGITALSPPSSATRAYLGVYERDDWCCQYCGERSDLTIDHLIPQSRGGGNDPANLMVACRTCNSKKGDRTPSEACMSLPSHMAEPEAPSLKPALARMLSAKGMLERLAVKAGCSPGEYSAKLKAGMTCCSRHGWSEARECVSAKGGRRTRRCRACEREAGQRQRGERTYTVSQAASRAALVRSARRCGVPVEDWLARWRRDERFCRGCKQWVPVASTVKGWMCRLCLGARRRAEQRDEICTPSH